MKRLPISPREPKVVRYLPTIYLNLRSSYMGRRSEWHRRQFVEHYRCLVGCQLRHDLTDSEVALLLADVLRMDHELVQADLLLFQKYRRRLGYSYGFDPERRGPIQDQRPQELA